MVNLKEIPKKFFIKETDIVFDPKIRQQCIKPYFDHPHGCPNFGKRPDCPPFAPLYNQIYKPEAKVAILEFDWQDYLIKRRQDHPDWTDRALKNPRHWQGFLRAELKKQVNSQIERINLNESHVHISIFNPEAMGVDLIKTLDNIGIELRFPPEKYMYRIALIAKHK